MKKAVILLSGGLDSATCLALAHQQNYACYALSFEYGQKSHIELAAAHTIAQSYPVIEHKTIRLDLSDIGGSSLVDKTMDVPTQGEQGEIPTTYVPARNTVFLSLALGWAEVLDADAIFIGVNAVDYSGYPDCRPEYITAFQALSNLATKRGVEGRPIHIHTPLLHDTKAGIIAKGTALGVPYQHTISCYQADPKGSACGVCDSCRLRRLGFEAANISDPTHYTQ